MKTVQPTYVYLVHAITSAQWESSNSTLLFSALERDDALSLAVEHYDIHNPIYEAGGMHDEHLTVQVTRSVLGALAPTLTCWNSNRKDIFLPAGESRCDTGHLYTELSLQDLATPPQCRYAQTVLVTPGLLAANEMLSDEQSTINQPNTCVLTDHLFTDSSPEALLAFESDVITARGFAINEDVFIEEDTLSTENNRTWSLYEQFEHPYTKARRVA
jgi:hypothetical protein